MIYDLPNYVSLQAPLRSASVSATANGAPIDLKPFVGKILYRLDAGNASAGTNPTLDLVFKESTDNSNWTNANVAFTQVTATSLQFVAYDTRAHGRYVRLDATIGGTNAPAFPACVMGVAQKAYNAA